MHQLHNFCLVFSLLLQILIINQSSGQEDGIDLGSMESWGFNGVRSDEVTLLSERKMRIKNLVYSGEGPAAWFMVGSDNDDFEQEFTDLDGVIIPDENGGCDRLGRYRGDDIELTLPTGMKFTDYDYLSIYCIRFSHNFGYIPIKKGIKFAAPVNKTAAAAVAPPAVLASVPLNAVKGGRQDNTEDDDAPGECDQEPERRNNRPAPPSSPPGEEDEEEEEEE